MKRKIFLLFEILILFLFVFFFVISLYIINISIIKNINSTKEKLLYEFKEITGFTLSYSKLSPNIINSIKISEVKIYTDHDVELELGDIIVDYSIINYLRDKKNPISFIKKIKLNNLYFTS